LAAAIGSAPWIQQEQAIGVLGQGDVAVAEDDDAGAGKLAARVAAEGLALAQDVD